MFVTHFQKKMSNALEIDILSSEIDFDNILTHSSDFKELIHNL